MKNTNQEDSLKHIVSHCKEYGFIFSSSEIYNGLSATYDYGPNGTELKNNLKNYWWTAMVRMYENIVGIDAAIFMHPTTWKASGHIEGFNDPLIDNKDSKKRYRADVLLEDYIAKIDSKISKEIQKAQKRFGESFDKKKFIGTNPRILKYQEKIDYVKNKLSHALKTNQLNEIKNLIEELEITDPVSGSKNWTNVRQFNLMFDTRLGSTIEEADTIYLRPETAQGIFVNFLNVQKSSRMKLPFGIAQIGKAFRNEIIARQFIFRMREFEQMEMQFFVKPGTEIDWYQYWKEERMKWHLSLGLGKTNYQFHDHSNLAHYANAACDIEFNFPMGFKELEGIHSRTDFDLKAHEKYSGKKMQFFDPKINKGYVPYVIETSIGLDRLFLAVLSSAYTQEVLKDQSTRVVLKIPKSLAPNKIAVLPLVNKDGLPEIAKNISKKLKIDYALQYDSKDAIGRRYRRQDAIGTPYCITVDNESITNHTVTIRDRDTMEQIRINIDQIENYLSKEINLNKLLQKLHDTHSVS